MATIFVIAIFAASVAVLVVPSISAYTYSGPSLNVSPASVTAGSSVNIQLAAGSSSTFTAPAGVCSPGETSPCLCNPNNPSTCFFPLQACDPGLNYYQINEATVRDPNGNQYMLGSSVTSGLADQNNGRFTNSPGGPFAPSINVSATDAGTIPFGTGAGGFFVLTSNLANPPNNVNPEGAYYWWTVQGNQFGSNLRLDQNPSINPTSIPGTYTVDLEGLVYCGGSPLFFDAGMQFTVTPTMTTTTTTTSTTTTLTCTGVTSDQTFIASNFNGNSIAGGDYIWFNSVLKLKSAVPAGGLTLFFNSQTITFTAGGTKHSLSVPDSEVIFSQTATQASTTFSGGVWITTVPASFGDNVFLSGLAFPVPAGGLPGGINPVTWSGTVSGSASYSIAWQWGAAVYTSFTTNYNSLGIKPTHSTTLDIFHNGDQAGTPENYKTDVTGGARGGGGSNWTGSYSPTGSASGTCP